MLDADGRIESWNRGAERIKGWTADEILGEHFSIFYPPEDLAAGRPRQALEDAARTGRHEEEGWRQRKDGSRFWAWAVLTAVRDPAGRLQGFAKVTRDLTERRRAEEERLRLARAEEAIRLRDEFVAVASHELNTPLATLQLQLQALQRRLEREGVAAAAELPRMARSVRRLGRLVADLRDVPRMASGRLELRRGEVALDEVARSAAAALGEQAAQAGSEVRVVAEAEGAQRGVWDRRRLERMVEHLVSNALRHGAGAPVEVRVRGDGGEAVLEVADGGPGLTDEVAARIFERFSRAAAVENAGGLGLGLFLAREVVRAHGGAIAWRPRPGGGSVFEVRLPLQPPAP
jgi:PAS domain S-box-containing protein